MPVYDINLNKIPDGRFNPSVPPIPGSIPFPRFGGRAGVLYDAAGAKVEFVVRCCTETGAVWRYERVDGRFVLDPGSLRINVVRELRPAPLVYASVGEPIPCPTGPDHVATSSARSG